MAKYTFTTDDDDAGSVDLMLKDVRAARAEALRFMGQMLVDSSPDRPIERQRRVTVVDGDGPVLTVDVSISEH